MALSIRPITLKAARRFVDEHHRHHRAPVGGLFAIGAEEDGEWVSVVIVGRPLARAFQDGLTGEVLRLASVGTPNACSMLYAAAWRACRAMGYQRLVTYTLAVEPGTSLKAAGWRQLYTTADRPQGWDTPSRRRTTGDNTGPKTLWEMAS